MQTNIVVRDRAKEKGVKLWEVAESLGVADTTFSRKLRREFSDDERAKVMAAIDQVAEKKEVEREVIVDHG